MRVVWAILLVLLALSADVTAADLYITWADASSDETGFEIYRATSYDGPYSLIATTAANVTSYADGPLLTALQLYCYKIRSCASTECSNYLGPICATTLALPGSSEFR
jgi:hypothetical protein